MKKENNENKINNITLTSQNKKERPFGIGGSDANKLVNGEWIDLYDEKINKESIDLSDVLPVQMGNATEQFNREWFAKQTNMLPSQETTVWYNDYIYGNLDGLIYGTFEGEETPIAVFEAKHTNAFNATDQKKLDQVDKYYPQLQHYMMVAKVKKAYLSMFFGNLKWDYLEVEEDKSFQQKLLSAYDYFWTAIQKENHELVVNLNWSEYHEHNLNKKVS